MASFIPAPPPHVFTVEQSSNLSSSTPYDQSVSPLPRRQSRNPGSHLSLVPTPPPLPTALPAAAPKTLFLFRHRIQPGGLYKPEAKRYILYVSDACPWSCRCLAYWALKHLHQAIQIGMAAPIWKFCPLHEEARQHRQQATGAVDAATAPPQQRLSHIGGGITTSVQLQHRREGEARHRAVSYSGSAVCESPSTQMDDYPHIQQSCPVACGGAGGKQSLACTCGWVFDPPRGFIDPLGRFSTVADIYLYSISTTGDNSNEVAGFSSDDDDEPAVAGRKWRHGNGASRKGSVGAVGSSATAPPPLTRTAYTLPILYDTHTNTIVNNCSSDICHLLNDMFNELAKAPEVNLTPRVLHGVIREMNKRLVTPIACCILECGRATQQLQYEREANGLYNRLDEVERLLAKQRYLCSSSALTDSDIRLCTILVRFDDVYAVCCRCNRKLIRCDYPHILEWLRDVVQTANILPIVANMSSIKAHYFLSPMNPIGPAGGFRIVPQGFGFERLLVASHRRGSEGTILPSSSAFSSMSSGYASATNLSSHHNTAAIVNVMNLQQDSSSDDVQPSTPLPPLTDGSGAVGRSNGESAKKKKKSKKTDSVASSSNVNSTTPPAASQGAAGF